MANVWTLHQEPHRHYKYQAPGAKKPSWQIGKLRIAGVTDVLDGGQNSLTGWAARQAIAASEQVAIDWLGAAPALATSTLSFGELAALQPDHPDNVRDAKGDSGNAAHDYLHARLVQLTALPTRDLPYGLKCALDDFFERHRPEAVRDKQGLRVERCVGDVDRAVAGTCDAQVWMLGAGGNTFLGARHRIDLKQSNTVQPKHFAQTAEYERDAILCGEEPSDYLTILHITPTGSFKLHSIAVGSPEHKRALDVFDAHLTIHRALPVLAKLLKEPA